MLLNINDTNSNGVEYGIVNAAVENGIKRRGNSKYPERLVNIIQDLKRECLNQYGTESAIYIGKQHCHIAINSL